MTLANTKAEHLWQEVITDEHHNKYEVVNDSVNIKVFDSACYLSELILKILPQNAYNYILEFNFVDLSDACVRFVIRPCEFLSNNSNIFKSSGK
jgi:hypothetical protein